MANLETPENVMKWLSDFSLTINHVRQGDFSPNHKAYDCTLSYGDKSIDVTYQSNPEFNSYPTVTDIIQSLVTDSQTWNNNRNIDAFAKEFMEPDTPISKVISTYNACKESYEWLCDNYGQPLYSSDLSKLDEMLSEHEDEIREGMQRILHEKAELEAYNKPPVPEGFVSIQEVMQQFDLGDYGDQITDHDESEDIGDAFSEIADNSIDLYYSGLLKWLPENYQWIEEADAQGLLEGCKGDLIKMTQMAQYVCYQNDLYDHQDDIVSYYAAHHLYDSGIYMVSEDMVDSFSICGENASRLDDGIDAINSEIKDQLISHFEEKWGDEELAEEMADEVISSNFTKVNPCIMNAAASRAVAELGYDQAFQNDWKDTLNDWKEILRNQHIEKLEQIIEERNSDPYAMIATINFPVWENLPTEEVFEEWYANDYGNLQFEEPSEDTFDHNEDILNDSFERLDAMLEKSENRWCLFPDMVEPDSTSLKESGVEKRSYSVSDAEKEARASAKEVNNSEPISVEEQSAKR